MNQHALVSLLNKYSPHFLYQLTLNNGVKYGGRFVGDIEEGSILFKSEMGGTAASMQTWFAWIDVASIQSVIFNEAQVVKEPEPALSAEEAAAVDAEFEREHLAAVQAYVKEALEAAPTNSLGATIGTTDHDFNPKTLN